MTPGINVDRLTLFAAAVWVVILVAVFLVAYWLTGW